MHTLTGCTAVRPAGPGGTVIARFSPQCVLCCMVLCLPLLTVVDTFAAGLAWDVCHLRLAG